jgi:hypothetical protein
MVRKYAAATILACTALAAFAQELPGEISGRWFWPERNVGQSFSLEEIQKNAGGFTAKLTWWTMDARCTVRGETVSGQLEGNEITFDARTQCNGFKARLARDGNGWKGTATTTGSSAVTVQLTAK